MIVSKSQERREKVMRSKVVYHHVHIDAEAHNILRVAAKGSGLSMKQVASEVVKSHFKDKAAWKRYTK